MKNDGGYFVVSLDLELFWGMFDKTTIAEYGDRIIGERTAIPRILEAFTQHGIRATWAGVGMLMARNRNELEALLPPPHLRPQYENAESSAYTHLESGAVLNDEKDDPYHFGSSLVKMILETPGQEFGNHTFSHYYCIDGYTNDPHVFARDIEAWNEIARSYGIEAVSIVFPRNQASHEALYTCAEKRLRAYRGNEKHFLYEGRKESSQSHFIRALRLFDHYVNVSGHHTYPLPHADVYGLYNIPSSRFFRPFMRKLSFFEPLRLRRIKRAMTHAAKRGEIYHLWWHPHNMGIDQRENFKNLETILSHYEHLKKKYGMESASMRDIVTRADERGG